MRQSAQGERVFIDILAFEQQLANEVAAANVVHEVAEFPITERVVTEILNDGASIGVSMRLPDLIVRESRKSLEQKWLDFAAPEQVNDFFVRENGVRRRSTATDEHDEKKSQRANSKQAPTSKDDACRRCKGVHELDPADDEENENDHKDHAYSSRRVISPTPAMRPSWQCTNESQDQDYDQYGSKHVAPFLFSAACWRPHRMHYWSIALS